MINLLDAALVYLSEGKPVVAVGQNKAPIDGFWTTRPEEEGNRLLRWERLRNQSEADVRREFSNGAYGIARILFPACREVVLDFDGKHAIEAWKKTGIVLPPTACNRSQSGGCHLYFKMPVNADIAALGVKRSVKVVKATCNCSPACGVDFLMNGIAVVPPTPGYREDPEHPAESAVELPQEILALVIAAVRTEKIRSTDGKVRRGAQHDTAIHLVGVYRAKGMERQEIYYALKAESEARFEPQLSEDELEYFTDEAMKWLPGVKPGFSFERSGIIEPAHLTDLGNAQRFSRQHVGKVLFCFERDQWLTWNGRNWEWDNSGEASRLAKQTILSIYQEASEEKDDDRRGALAHHAARSEANSRIQAMLALARSEPAIPVTIEQLDKHPMLFNTQNGVVDIANNRLVAHDPTYLITQISPCSYDPEARCDTFLEFLNRIMDGNAKMIDFLQRWFGYCLTGDVSEHAVNFAYGKGANGKTTLLKIILHVMGSYADMAAPNLLLTKHNEEHPAGLADLIGRRLVCTIEIEEGRRFDAALFKWLSGGDRIKARFMRENFFSFEPTHKLTIAANHKPTVADSSVSFWRRMRLSAFNVQIPDEEQDKRLDEKLRAEADGVLAWLIKGAQKWRREGLGEPIEVKEATKGYRAEQDFLAPFFDEHIAKCSGFGATVKDLYERFKTWADASGERPITKKRLSTMLNERGYENRRDPGHPKQAYTWIGIDFSAKNDE